MKIADMPIMLAAGAAGTYQSIKGGRQLMYELAKEDPDYRSLFEQSQDLYFSLCERMGVPVEPIFDIDEYKKSQRYQDIMSGRIR